MAGTLGQGRAGWRPDLSLPSLSLSSLSVVVAVAVTATSTDPPYPPTRSYCLSAYLPAVWLSLPAGVQTRSKRSRGPFCGLRGITWSHPMIHVEYTPLSQIQTWRRNPKDHDLGQLHQSMARWGYVQPVLLNEDSREVGGWSWKAGSSGPDEISRHRSTRGDPGLRRW